MPNDCRVMVFDLDDTLYLERDFVRSGFAAADDWLRNKTGVEGLAARCSTLFEAGRRTRIFDEALASMGIVGIGEIVPALVDVYRGHLPAISLAADAKRYLEKPPVNCRRAIITDGPAATQMAKVKALGLDSMIDLIIYTDSWGKEFWKPHARAFEAIQHWAKAEPAQLVYIADNPLKDFVTPRNLGWLTVRVLRSERVHLADAPTPRHEAHAQILDLDALDPCLATLALKDWQMMVTATAHSPGKL